ncbi:MAG: DMT family transporter [Candidatus Limnocylindria bacterium]
MTGTRGRGSVTVARLGSRPVLTATIGALTIAFSGILVRLADVPPATAAVFRCAYALPVLAVLALAEQRRYGPRGGMQRSVALLAGVFFAIDLVLWHHAIAFVGAGLATVLGNTQVVIVGVVAWLMLGERPSGRILVAVPMAMAGVVLISGIIGSGAYGDDPTLGVIFGVGTALAYAAFIVILREGNRDLRRPAGPLFDATLAAAVTSLAIGLPLGEIDLAVTWPAHAWLIALALSSQVIGWLLISVSLPRLPAAVTSVVLTIQPVGSVALAVVLLGESPSPLQLLGVLAILVGLMLATMTGRRAQAVTRPQPA